MTTLSGTHSWAEYDSVHSSLTVSCLVFSHLSDYSWGQTNSRHVLSNVVTNDRRFFQYLYCENTWDYYQGNNCLKYFQIKQFLAACEGRDCVMVSASARTVLSGKNQLVGVSVRCMPPQRPWGLWPPSLRQARSQNEFYLNNPQKFWQIRMLAVVQIEVQSLILSGEKIKSFRMLFRVFDLGNRSRFTC